MNSQCSTVRILIVEDHPIVRHGYAQLIRENDDLEVCGFAVNVTEALARIVDTQPDLAIVDISLQDSMGLDLITRIRSDHPHVKVLVVSAHDEALFARRVLEAGALGYINKRDAIDRLLEGIRSVLAGEVFLNDAQAHLLLRDGIDNHGNGRKSASRGLTNRELEVFLMIGRGKTTRQIAECMHLSPKTVERYKENIKHKQGIGNSTELVQQATRWVMENGG